MHPIGQGTHGHSLNLPSCSSDSQLEAAVNGHQGAAEIINDLRHQYHLLTRQRGEVLQQVDSSSGAVADLKLHLAEARDKLAASEAALACEQAQSKGLQEEAQRLKQQADEVMLYFTEHPHFQLLSLLLIYASIAGVKTQAAKQCLPALL